jgi:hypothetical protein
MTNTYIKISTVTVGSGGAASIAFTSIPQTYTDLSLNLSLRSNSTADTDDVTTFKINGVTTNQSGRLNYGTGTLTGSTTTSSGELRMDAPTAVSTASVFGNTNIYLPNYASANYKSINMDAVNENNTTNAYFQIIHAGLWSSSDAITSLEFLPTSGTLWVQYTTATLYGIKSS